MYNSNPSQTEDRCKKYNDAANGHLGSSHEEQKDSQRQALSAIVLQSTQNSYNCKVPTSKQTSDLIQESPLENLNSNLRFQQLPKSNANIAKPNSGKPVSTLNKCTTASNDLQRAADSYKKSKSTELVGNYKQSETTVGNSSQDTIGIGTRSLRNTTARQQRAAAQAKLKQQEQDQQPFSLESSLNEQCFQSINKKEPFKHNDENSNAVIPQEQAFIQIKSIRKQQAQTNQSQNGCKKIARNNQQLLPENQNLQIEDFHPSQMAMNSQTDQQMIESPMVLHRTATLPSQQQIFPYENLNQTICVSKQAKCQSKSSAKIGQVQYGTNQQQTQFQQPVVVMNKSQLKNQHNRQAKTFVQGMKEDISPGSFKSAEQTSLLPQQRYSKDSSVPKLRSNRKPKKDLEQSEQQHQQHYDNNEEQMSPQQVCAPKAGQSLQKDLDKAQTIPSTHYNSIIGQTTSPSCQKKDDLPLQLNGDAKQIGPLAGSDINLQGQQTKIQSDVKMVREFNPEVSADKIQNNQKLAQEPLGPQDEAQADQNECINHQVKQEIQHMVVDQLSNIVASGQNSGSHSRVPSDQEALIQAVQNPELSHNLPQQDQPVQIQESQLQQQAVFNEQNDHSGHVIAQPQLDPIQQSTQQFQNFVRSEISWAAKTRSKWNSPNGFLIYAEDVYNWMRKSELQGAHLTDVTYMERQPEINTRMREILIDWLIDVHQRFKLVPETLFITVNIVDRYLAKRFVEREKLQLLGTTAMLIACKYQEIYPPSLADLVFMCNNAYIAREVLEMECTVLSVLEYDMTFPTSLSFLETYLEALNVRDLPTELCTHFFLEVSLISFPIQRYSPSTLALAALFSTWHRMNSCPFYAQMGLGLGPYYQNVTRLIGIESLRYRNKLFSTSPKVFELDVYACAGEMAELLNCHLSSQSGLNAIRNKYVHCRMACVHPLLNLPVNYPPSVRPNCSQQQPFQGQ